LLDETKKRGSTKDLKRRHKKGAGKRKRTLLQLGVGLYTREKVTDFFYILETRGDR